MKNELITRLNSLDKSRLNDSVELLKIEGYKTVNLWQSITNLNSLETFIKEIETLFSPEMECQILRLANDIIVMQKEIYSFIKQKQYQEADNLGKKVHSLKIELFKFLRNDDARSFYQLNENVIDVFEFVF